MAGLWSHGQPAPYLMLVGDFCFLFYYLAFGTELDWVVVFPCKEKHSPCKRLVSYEWLLRDRSKN